MNCSPEIFQRHSTALVEENHANLCVALDFFIFPIMPSGKMSEGSEDEILCKPCSKYSLHRQWKSVNVFKLVKTALFC